MGKIINENIAELLRAIFQFPETELEMVTEQVTDEVRAALAAPLSSLTPREECVMRSLYGLDGEPVSTSTLAQKFSQQYGRGGVGTDKVRAIKDKALRKLRHITRSGPLAKQLHAAGVEFAGLKEVLAEQCIPIEQRSIKALELPARVEQALLKADIELVFDLLEKDADDVRRIQGIRHKSLAEIRQALDRRGLRLKASY